MSKKTAAIIIELIPIVSAVLSFVLIQADFDSRLIGKLIPITMVLAFLGFVFFFVGRRLDGRDRVVRILGVFDWLSTLYVFVLYTMAMMAFGL